MRIVIDTTLATRGPSGTGIYVERLTAALRDAGHVVVAVRNRWRGAPGGGTLRSVANYVSDLLWTVVALPWLAWRRGCDVIHHPLPALAPLAPCPQVVTVHDLAFLRRPELFDPRFARWAARAHRAAVRRAGAVVCVSEATADDVVAHWNVARERIVVAHHGAGQLEGLAAGRVAPRHFLYVGDDEPRKNLRALLDAHRRYRDAGGTAPLVLAGRVAAAAPPGVEVVWPFDSERLAELHGAAIALVHPAVEEGFGMTLLEAMSAGTPVLAVRTRAALEVCGLAALWVAAEPADELPASLAGAMQALATDPDMRERLATSGRERAAEFSWAQSARAHIAAYTLALE